MHDIPAFTTENGVASLTLSQIPYTKKAFVRFQAAADPRMLLSECVAFCKAAGAEEVYGTGHSVCTQYPVYTALLHMSAPRASFEDTDAALFPVTEETLELWRSIYNEKVRTVAAGSWMTIEGAKQLLKAGDGYFIHRREELLGIGKASGDVIGWVAAVKQGAGADVVLALNHALCGENVHLEVASNNEKAIRLYERLGFLKTEEILVWNQIF